MIALDFTPTEEARISTVARQIGLAPAEYVKKLVKEHLPPIATAVPAVDEENAAAIAQIQVWMKEEATDNAEEIHEAATDLNELMRSLDRNRVESGERPLFP